MIVYRKAFLGLHLLFRQGRQGQQAVLQMRGSWRTGFDVVGAAVKGCNASWTHSCSAQPVVVATSAEPALLCLAPAPARRLYGSAILRTAIWGVIAALQTTLLCEGAGQGRAAGVVWASLLELGRSVEGKASMPFRCFHRCCVGPGPQCSLAMKQAGFNLGGC